MKSTLPPTTTAIQTTWSQRPFAVQRFREKMAFWISAIFSPYLVIPVGVVAMVASVTRSRKDFFLWTSLCVLFTTVIPALFVVVQIARGKITDVHVMERHQRSGPFLTAVASAALGALVMKYYGARLEVWGIALVFSINGLVFYLISSRWKISMHVAVLSAAILAAGIMVPHMNPRYVLWTLPLLIWARYARGRHTVWQGISAIVVAVIVSCLAIFMLYRLYDISFMAVVHQRLL